MKKLLIFLVFLCSCCHPRSECLDPHLTTAPCKGPLQALPSPFPPLSEEDLQSDWGKELKIGRSFGRELDLYRSITALKRAAFLLPPDQHARALEIQYDILLAYYLAGKYQEVIESFEEGSLGEATPLFPPFRDLLIILLDSYKKCGDPYRVKLIQNLIEQFDRELSIELQLYDALATGDLRTLENFPKEQEWLYCFKQEALSVRRAQVLNAVLPGAGYYYTGQRSAAFTSFFLNASFIAAAAEFFIHGYTAAGIITTSLEMGWYFGGINGAGLSAKAYNEHLYESYARDQLCNQKLFPLLMLRHAF